MSLPDGYESCVADPAVWACNATSGDLLCTKQEQLKGNEFSEVSLELYSDPSLTTACAAP